MKYEIVHGLRNAAINLLRQASHGKFSHLEVEAIIQELQRLPIIKEIEKKIEDKVCGKPEKQVNQ